jgi:hypothetical protein
VNTVRLSGTLMDVQVGSTERGCTLAKARIRFNPADDCLPFFAVGKMGEQLAGFEVGSEILITGRLLARGVGLRVAIAADKVEPVSLHAPDARADIDFFQTMRAHGRNAQVKGR